MTPSSSFSASVVAGQNVTYTLVVTNAGPQTATIARVLELIAAEGRMQVNGGRA